MKQFITLWLLALASGISLRAQTSLIPFTGIDSVSSNTTLCTHGGCGNPYGNNADGYIIIKGQVGLNVLITGTYSTATSGDRVRLYAGTNVVGTPVGTYSGNGSFSYSGSPGQSLTVRFSSNATLTSTGLQATVSYVTPPAPTVSGFTPTKGRMTDTVVITGSNFIGATAVSFGDTAARFFTVVNSTTIRAVPGTGSTGSVRVVTPGGVASMPGFIYNTVFVGASTTYITDDAQLCTFPGCGMLYNANMDDVVEIDSQAGRYIQISGVYNTASFADRIRIYNAPMYMSYLNIAGALIKTYSGTGNFVFSAAVNQRLAVRFNSNAGATGTGLLATVRYRLPNQPTIASFSPTVASAGDTVTILGSNLSGVSSVSFGGLPAIWFSNIDTGSIVKAVVGAGTSGSISITTFSGSASLNGFSHTASPVISYTGGNLTYPVGAPITPRAPTNVGGVMSSAFLVNTWAGLPTVSGSVDGPATSARFSWPSLLATDIGGNVIVADAGWPSKVRLVDALANVSTVAGSPGSGMVNGPASSSQFNGSSGVAVDDTGNIYVTDRDNHLIRKISVNGVVSTIAGVWLGYPTPGYVDGPANQARFNYPTAIAWSKDGNLYISDCSNHCIRKISPNGMVSTLAGNGTSGFVNNTGNAARFSFPTGLVLDTSGNLYVADNYNHRIRRITPVGQVTTYAGGGGGVAIDPTCSPICGFKDSTGIYAGFTYPNGLTIDAKQNIYVTELVNRRIRRIAPNRVVTTVAGQGLNAYTDGAGTSASFSYPVGITVFKGEQLVVSDGRSLRRIVPPGGYSVNPPLPAGLTLDSSTGVLSGTPLVPTPLTPYVVTAKNIAGTSSWTLNIATTASSLYGPFVTSVSPMVAFCRGGQVTIAFSAGFFNPANVFTVQLSNSFGSFVNPTILGTVNGTSGGTISVTIPLTVPAGSGYRIRVVASNPTVLGASTSNSFTILSNPSSAQAAIMPTATQSLCPGGTVLFSVPANNVLTYQWLLNDTAIVGATDTSFTATAPGNYSVRVTNGAGCYSTSPATAFNFLTTCLTGPTLTSLSPATSFCTGGQVTVNFSATNFNAANVFTAQLSNSTGSFASPTILGTLSGANGGSITGTLSTSQAVGSGYRVRIVASSPSLVSAVSPVNIPVFAQPLSTQVAISPTGNQSTCANSTVALSVPASTGFLYQWSLNGTPIPGATNNVFPANVAGSYTATVTNTNNCTRTGPPKTVSLLATPPSSIAPSGNIGLCNGQSATLQANVGGGLSYQWRLNGTPVTGATGSSYSTSIPGSYTVAVSNTSGCTVVSAPTVLANSCMGTPTVTGASNSGSYCQGGGMSINFTASGFNPGNVFTAQLSGSTGSFGSPTTIGTLANTTGGSLLASLPTTQILGTGYRVRIVSSDPVATSPINTGNLTVSAMPASGSVALTPTGNPSICAGSSVTISAPVNTALQFLWRKDTIAISGATANSYSATANGNYSVQVTNSNGCSRVSASKQVTVTPLPATTFTITNLTGGNKSLYAAQGSAQYQWYMNGNPISGATARTYVASVSGSYHLVVTASGCSATGTAVAVSVGGSNRVAATAEVPEVRMVIYPNPSREAATLVLAGDVDAEWQIRIWSGNGVEVETFRVATGLAAPFGQSLAAGVYRVEAIGNGKRLVQQWVKN